jgi:hypothetical protein
MPPRKSPYLLTDHVSTPTLVNHAHFMSETMNRTLVCLSALVLALFAAPLTAAAQTEKGNVAVSYGYLHDPDLNFPIGWVVAATGNIDRTFAMVGEIGGNYKRIALFRDTLHLRVHSFLGGLKVQGYAAPKVVAFTQVLLGETLFGASAAGEGDSENAFSIQPGAGVDFKLTRNAGIRVQGDYRSSRAQGESINEFRFAVGGVFGFGRR